jgi:hypothetical protein
LNQHFTDEEKKYLIEFIQINSNPKTKLKHLMDKIENNNTNRTEWHESIELRYNQWLAGDKLLEEKINQQVYPYKNLDKCKNILKKFMLDK